MILDHNKLVGLLRKLDAARAAAVEGTVLYCMGTTDGRDGVHGRAHLGIDSHTEQVVCTKCYEG